MPRAPRVDFPGALHHVMNRGAAHGNVFVEQRDYEDFLRIVGVAAGETAMELHAYCLSPNH
jgi:putative transposase